MLTDGRTGLSRTPTLTHNLRPRSILEHPSYLRNSSGVASPEKGFIARVQEIKDSCPDPYPRLSPDTRSVSCAEFRTRYAGLENDQTVEQTVAVHGTPSWLDSLACT